MKWVSWTHSTNVFPRSLGPFYIEGTWNMDYEIDQDFLDIQYGETLPLLYNYSMPPFSSWNLFENELNILYKCSALPNQIKMHSTIISQHLGLKI